MLLPAIFVIAEQGVRPVVLEPECLVRHERLVGGDDLFRGDQTALLDLQLFLLRLEAFDRHARVLQDQWTGENHHRHVRGV